MFGAKNLGYLRIQSHIVVRSVPALDHWITRNYCAWILPNGIYVCRPLMLGPWDGSAGNMSEIVVSFALPTVATTLGMVVMVGADPSNSGTVLVLHQKHILSRSGGSHLICQKQV
jgi:hypothetical protein